MRDNSPLSVDEACVFVKYLLLEGLENGEIRYWRVRWQTDAGMALRRRLEALLTTLLGSNGLTAKPWIEWKSLVRPWLASASYRRRLIDLALEAVLSEPLAPELCIRLAASSRHELSSALPGEWNHVVVFASPVFFTHEFYPLAVDACVHDSEHFGNPRTNVLAAHIDWLADNGQLKRILYLDFSLGRFIETELDIPMRSDSVQFLCMGSQERESHALMAQRFECVQVNPASVSRLADDKAATLAAWSALGLDVPVYQEIVPGDLATAYCFLDNFAEIVVKPNQATEGEHVAFFRRDQAHARQELARHLECCWAQGAAIAQQRRDGVSFRNPVSGAGHSLALRLNLAFDGARHCLESGYAQLGLDGRHPAACGRGGHIVAVDVALSGLVCGGKPIRLDSGDWNRIRAQAECAAGLFDGLLLMGLDVLLDQDLHGNITPVFLEANPRPAGLSHSRFLTDDPLTPAQIGVSLKLWDGIYPVAS
ncbi:MAG: hypothetical protein Q7U57_01700 [Methylovulum sp.]|nr:hypothetical protein [Methylovulum sp.]